MRGRDVAALNERERGKYLVATDLVIEVTLGDASRAYPLRVLNWHEVVNDALSEVPIAVTYHPHCHGVAVFDRRVGGRVLELAVSGLLYNSNQLLFDRRTDGRGESLWSQLLARADEGPAAREGLELDVLPASLARWDDWLPTAGSGSPSTRSRTWSSFGESFPRPTSARCRAASCATRERATDHDRRAPGGVLDFAKPSTRPRPWPPHSSGSRT